MMEINRTYILAAALVWLFVCATVGYYKGLMIEVYSIVKVVLSVIALIFIAKNISILRNGFTFGAAFVIINVLLGMLGKVLNIVDHLPILKSLNRVGGTLIGFMKGLLVLGLLYLCFSKIQ